MIFRKYLYQAKANLENSFSSEFLFYKIPLARWRNLADKTQSIGLTKTQIKTWRFLRVLFFLSVSLLRHQCCLLSFVACGASSQCTSIVRLRCLSAGLSCLVHSVRSHTTRVCWGIMATGFSPAQHTNIYHKSGIAPWGKVNSGISVALLN